MPKAYKGYYDYRCGLCGEPKCIFLVPECEAERPDLPRVCPWRSVGNDGKTHYKKAEWVME